MKKHQQDGPGSLDPTFGEDGLIALPVFADQDRFVTGLQAYEDHMLVSAMTTENLEARYAMARFLENSQLDPSFGAAGLVFGTFRPQAVSGTETIAIAPDGSLWVVGWMQSADKPFTPLLAHFLEDGSPDNHYNAPYCYQSLDMPAGHNLLLHASTLHAGTDHVLISVNTQAPCGRNHARLYRLGLQGEPGFASAAWIDIAHGADEVFVTSVIQQDRTFLVAGTLKTDEQRSQGFIARFHDDGTPDLSFGEQDAFQVYSAPGLDRDIAFNQLLQRPDGRLTVVGHLPHAQPEHANAMVWQFIGDGTIDATFNAGNPAVVTFSVDSRDEWQAATLHADGKLVVAGHASRYAVHLARYTTDGRLDQAFGEDGLTHLDIANDRSMAISALSPSATLLAFNGRGPGGFVGLLAKFRN
ncbi:hypothetical protein G3435_13105 [Pseudomonas sp. MAFF212428]|uniref:Delta-60 repeat domain-containing protein n=1 Tax=Pseudomonas brassicae TaxID=2708063 RepID=A0A6B3NID1_9PSED|nr:hypothetical protein [Pseudomonas brassicae]NER60675.1 hypothetical protein [Pseudomonas brassicae]NER63062.1 hypothetical protein [Pseudomonas brassicae]